MKFDPHRLLTPQVEKIGSEPDDIEDVIDGLKELARRVDQTQDGLLNMARRFIVLDANLERAGIDPSSKNPDKGFQV